MKAQMSTNYNGVICEKISVISVKKKFKHKLHK
jgi:hypothetical protein